MKSRLEDLIGTADRQFAARSYDAAIDTYRTALSEPGAVEAGVPDRLEAVVRARDESRGIIRAAEPPPPPVEPPGESPPAPQKDPEPEPSPPEVDPQPDPPPKPIDPPSFQLLELEPYDGRLEPPDLTPPDVRPISILDTQAPPEEIDPNVVPRIIVAALIFVFVCAIVMMLR